MVGKSDLRDFTRWNECLELWIIEDSGLVGCDAVSRDCSAFTVEYLILQDEGTMGTLTQGYIIRSQKT